MKILVAHNPEIRDFPPVRNLVQVLLSTGHDVFLIAKGNSSDLNIKNVNLHCYYLDSYNSKNIIGNTLISLKNKTKFRKKVVEIMETYDLIWTTTDTTVRVLGKSLMKYKHIMQLMELIEYMPLFGTQKYFKFKIQRIARSAWKIVVPEFNRAYIQKAYWNLSKLPLVLPNKPFNVSVNNLSEDVIQCVNKIKGEKRKIILYQGVFSSDRKLDSFAEAISQIEDKYCFVIMGKRSSIQENLCKKYKNIIYIPFIQAPFHLAITSLAHIGIISYVHQKYLHYSILNSLYCAPNKIYEYAGLGKPIISNDLPGIFNIIDNYKMGVCIKKLDTLDIIKAIETIEENYFQMCKNSLKFYNSIDLDRIVNEEILEQRLY